MNKRSKTHILFGIFYLLSIFSIQIKAQKFDEDLSNDFHVLKSKGEMPDFFISSSTQKYYEDLNQINSKKEKYSIKKEKKKFALKSNFVIDDLLQNGRVLYNDDISLYVNKVANKVLSKIPTIKNEVNVLVIKSSNVNAFTTQGGLVFVTLGLIAQLENEAQLAFILAHEFIHHKNDHVIESHIESSEINSGKHYKGMKDFDKQLTKSNFSKEKEYEADKEGLKVYKKLGYSMKALKNVFDVLEYSYLPFDILEFDTTFFNTPNFTIPTDYFLPKTAAISSDDDYDDRFSSHPNIRSRKVEIKKILKTESLKGDKYLISEKEFKSARDYARFELCDIYIQTNVYSRAIYSAYLLKEKYPNNLYLDKIISKSLYSMAKYIEFYDETLSSVEHENVQGASQQLYYLFSKLKAKEIMVLATLRAWDLYLKNETPFNKMQAEAGLRSLVKDFGYSSSDFYKKTKDQMQQKIDKEDEDEDEDEEKSKYDKIKDQQVKSSIDGEADFLNFAFVDLFKNEEFTDKFDLIEEAYFEEKRNNEKVKSKEELKIERKKESLIKKRGHALGINKIVLLDPYYLVYNNERDNKIQYIDTEMSQSKFKNILLKNAKNAGLDLEIIDPKSLNKNDTEKYNDLSILNNWVREWSDINKFADGDDFLNPNTEYTQKLVEKYGTEYFLWTGVQSTRETGGGRGYYVLLTLLYPYLMPVTVPLTLANALISRYNSYFYSVLFNVKTGKTEFVDRIYLDTKDRNDIINSRTYNMFNQIKSTR